MNARQFVLGVDGGGTKTLAWLALRQPTRDQDVLGRGRAGPSNPSAVGFPGALAAVQQAIEAAFLDAGIPPQPVAAACLAIAGADRHAESDRVANWAKAHSIAEQLHLSNDAEPLLACTKLGWGVALIGGTGSFALGRNSTGTTAKVGGWGYRYGDEGSAYRIVVDGLAAAMRFADGRGPETCLLRSFMTHFSVDAPRELITPLHAPQMDRRRLAELAPMVLEQWQEGDAVARSIVQRAATALAEMVLAAKRRLDLPKEFPLVLTGGLLTGSEEIRSMLQDELTARQAKPDSIVVREAVRGAVELARQIA